MKNICIYCTQTGKSKQIAETVAEKKGVELLRISDGKERKGFFGRIATMMQQLSGKLTEPMAFKTQYPLSEYDTILFVFPIWCEDVCILMKSFLHFYGKELNGRVYFMATHMSKMTYEKKTAALNGYVKNPSGIFSVRSKDGSFVKTAEEYTNGIFE